MITNPINVLTIYGTRPEAIKLAPVILALQEASDFYSHTCVTAQHREMLDQINKQFDIAPDYDLDVMEVGQPLHQISSRVIDKVSHIIKMVAPDWVFVQGDTTSAMSAALAAYYQNTRVGHVEAGLRTFNKWEPFPEEVNRRVIDVVADLYFAPTETAKHNLLKEGVPPNKIVITGNTVVDSLHLISQKDFDIAQSALAEIPWEKKIVLVTAHRRENIGEPLYNICRAISKVANSMKAVHFVFPVHRNPDVEKIIRSHLEGKANISLLPPLNYHELIYILKQCYFVMTDSGGIQEEAPTFGKKVLVLRNTTERPEAVKAGFSKVIGTDTNNIVHELNFYLKNPDRLEAISKEENPFGDGNASQRILDSLRSFDDKDPPDEKFSG